MPNARLTALGAASLLAFAAAAPACSDAPTNDDLTQPAPGSTGEDASAPATDAGRSTSPSNDAGASDGGGGEVGETFSGEATYYDADGTGACGDRTEDTALVGAMNAKQYSKAVCGRCAEITGPLGSVTVEILDRCGGCDHGDVDLSSTAFRKIANLRDGRVKITWRFVPCP